MWRVIVIVEKGGYEYEIHINKILSSPQIDRELIKYLIFHELLHQNGYWDHNIDFRLREWQFPNSEEHDGVLERLAMEYNMEEYYKNAVRYETHQRIKDDKNNEKLVEEHKETLPKGIQEGYKYCRNCGNKLPDSAKFCDKCGEKLDY